MKEEGNAIITKEYADRWRQLRGFSDSPRRKYDKQAEGNPEWSKGQREAITAVNQAIKRGKLSPTDQCQICGQQGNLEGHHWRGYDHPLDVWWLCGSCNCTLRGEAMHSGLVTLEEAQAMVRDLRAGEYQGHSRLPYWK